jgi:hypothetical protein
MHPIRLLATMPRQIQELAAVYVVTLGAAGAYSFSSTGTGVGAVELTAFALMLPGLVVSLPVIYLVGAIAWQVRADLPGEPMWPVTITFTLLFAATAMVNVVILWWIWSASRARMARG